MKICFVNDGLNNTIENPYSNLYLVEPLPNIKKLNYVGRNTINISN